MNLLKNKNILLAITGSIAAYKGLELARLYIKAGGNVKVLMTKDAKRFISPLSFEAITGNIVLHEDTESWTSLNNHIHITKNIDAFVIAPATANTINKIAYGIGDNLLTQTVLAYNKHLIIAPSANTNMLENKITKDNLKKLKNDNHVIIEPQTKLLACLDVGKGALAEPLEIFYSTCRHILKNEFWKNKNVLITGGGTIEDIDFVRCLSNHSSGKMANALSLCLYIQGANVTLLSSQNKINGLNIKFQKFTNSATLKTLIDKEINNMDYLFMTAAVSDYLPKEKTNSKLKKSALGKTWNLELVENIDILKSLEKNHTKIIAFKAETNNDIALENAKNMLNEKNLDAVCLNILDEKITFGSDETQIVFITKNNEKIMKKDTKLNISFQILKETKKL